jgi:hypothetical protein
MAADVWIEIKSDETVRGPVDDKVGFVVLDVSEELTKHATFGFRVGTAGGNVLGTPRTP